LFHHSGWLEAGPEEAVTTSTPVKSLTFYADKPYLYNTQDQQATMLLTVTYDEQGET